VRRTTWAVLALLPALLSGCGAVSGLPGGPGAADSAAGDGTADGDSWVVTDVGRATPSPTPSRGASPAPGPTGGFLPLPSATPTTRPTAKCAPNTFKFDKLATLDVRPGATSAVLTWYNVGGYNLREFRLYAISQDLERGAQRDVGFVTVGPSVQCGWMSATIGNLDRGTTYVFSVDAVVDRRSGDGTHAATVARSGPADTL
jgi:hypothetical protein